MRLDVQDRVSKVDPREEIASAMTAVRASFCQVLSALPGDVRNLPALMALLGLSRTLAWKFLRVCRADDPFSAAEQMPGTEGVSIVLQAARGVGVSDHIISQAEESTARFYAMVGRHAPTRPALRRLVGGLARQGRERSEINHRRKAMEANTHIWGLHAAVQYNSAFLFDRDPQNPHPERTDAAFLSGFCDMIRARDDVAWEFLQTTSRSVHGAAQVFAPSRMPLFPEDQYESIPLIRELSTNPPPKIRKVELPNLSVAFELVPGHVGKSGAVSVILGELYKDYTCRRAEEDSDIFQFSSRLRTPVDVVISEFHVQRSLFYGQKPTAFVLDTLRASLPFPNEWGVMPPKFNFDVELVSQGRADRAPTVDEMPKHKMLRDLVYKQIGHNPADFDSWTFSLFYPPIPGSLMVQMPLPN